MATLCLFTSISRAGTNSSAPSKLSPPQQRDAPVQLRAPQWTKEPIPTISFATEEVAPVQQQQTEAAPDNPAEPVSAMPEVAPPLPAQETGSGVGTSQSGEPQVDVGAGAQIEINGLIQRFTTARQKNKQIQMVFTGEARAVFDDNIFIRSSAKESDFSLAISPGFAVGWGDLRNEIRRADDSRFGLARLIPIKEDDEDYQARTFLYLRYSPTVTIFLDHGSLDALDHDAALDGQWKKAYLTLGFHSAFQTLSTPDIDVGGRVNRTLYTETLTSTYDYSDRTSLEFDLSGVIRNYQSELSSKEWTSQNWINYAYGARTTVSVGAKLGYLEVQNSPGQFYEQLLARGTYSVTNKIAIEAQLGIEAREIESGGKNSFDPVFGLGVAYKPFEQTYVTVNASRSIENSASAAGEDIEFTGFDLSLKQRFFKRYFLGLATSYRNAVYRETFFAGSASRTDNTVSVRPTARMELTKKAALEVGYEFRNNSSTLQRVSFTENQIFIQVDVLF